MEIYPAIDLVGGRAVRLTHGDFARMTVYSEDPVGVARDFAAQGARWVHLVDLEGARDGGTPNFETIRRIKETVGLRCEVGGGIRSEEMLDRYLQAGIDRAILGTAALTDRGFLQSALNRWGERIAVGVDLRDGLVAVKGWLETSGTRAEDFCRELEGLGVRTIIVTDISRDGAMQGSNTALYRRLSACFSGAIIASGGVSSLEDVRRLRSDGIAGAIIGKAYYTGAIDLKTAIEEAV